MTNAALITGASRGLGLALAMNQHFKLKNIIRALLLLPFIVPTVLSTVAWMWILDPAFAPGVSHREPGGLSTRQVLDWIHAVDRPIVGADIVEYNPRCDISNITATVAARVI